MENKNCSFREIDKKEMSMGSGIFRVKTIAKAIGFSFGFKRQRK